MAIAMIEHTLCCLGPSLSHSWFCTNSLLFHGSQSCLCLGDMLEKIEFKARIPVHLLDPLIWFGFKSGRWFSLTCILYDDVYSRHKLAVTHSTLFYTQHVNQCFNHTLQDFLIFEVLEPYVSMTLGPAAQFWLAPPYFSHSTLSYIAITAFISSSV